MAIEEGKKNKKGLIWGKVEKHLVRWVNQKGNQCFYITSLTKRLGTKWREKKEGRQEEERKRETEL